MSDSIEELLKQYQQNVLGEEYSRSVGLFPIPEYPEWEERGMWSTALDAILTTLRYLAPATLLTLFWGQQSFLFKLLKHIDSAFRAIFSSDEQKQAVLRWLAEVGPVRVEHLDTVWRHGWILCGVLDGALPGACAGHPPARLSLKHAQAIADHYLGVEPVFSRQELESCDSLSRHQEWKLATYLDRIRLALAKLTPPVSRPTSQRTSPDNKPETTQVTLDYVARGSGLAAAQVNYKAYFKVYPTAQQSVDPGEINVLIRGPRDSYGMLILPPILGKAQLFRQKLLGLEPKSNFTENALPITQGATYLRNYGKNDMNKTYFIPKTNNDIDIEVETRDDHARVGYTVNCLGKYEIAITSRGQSIVGSPFKVTASNDIVGVLAKESFCLEDGEEIDIVDVKTDRKVVLRIVDFVTEKMLLRENGCLEKITEEEAKFLLHNDNVDITNFKSKLDKPKAHEQRKYKFIIAANKVIKMNRVCNMFNNLKNKRMLSSHKQCTSMLPKSQQDIPDIVNSTFSETNMHAFIITEKQNRVIIPENISVSLMTEKPKQYQDDNQSLNESESNTDIIFQSPDYLEKYKILRDPFEDEDLSIETTQSSNNPFINDMYTESYKIEKKLGAFLATEYETNNSQGEVIEDSLKKVRDNQLEGSLESACNPFVDLNVASHERSKSPVFKIISGQITKRAESLYIDFQRQDTIEEILGNEFINPFFTHHHESNQYEEALPVTDFIIGAPVSLPPILRAGSPEPHIDSIVLSGDSGILDSKVENQNLQIELGDSTLVPKLQSEINSSGHSSSHTTNSSNEFYDSKLVSNIPLPGISPKKETWDSAYVSIDDNSSSPDSNNNDNSLSEPLIKQPFPPSDEMSTMGPAEKEIWETCSELKENVNTYKIHEDTKISKRPTFTPIIEETEKSLNTDMKDSINETDPVTAAFCELNEIFENYFPQSENGSVVTTENNSSQNLEIEYMVDKNNISVDSASEELSDVKRHVRELEGMISEVQGSVTESDSASRILRVHNDSKQHKEENKDETKFGAYNHSNIVLERKKYWDEKIRLIQAKTDEMKAQQKKRRVYSKPLKHNDSLSKKKGKQMIKNFLNATDEFQKYSKPVNIKQSVVPVSETLYTPLLIDQKEPDEKLVEKWKTFWDSKLEIEKESEGSYWKSKHSQKVESPKTVQNIGFSIKENNLTMADIVESPSKQEIPEEVFIAFETSPKRFFGTSRKQILNKIDTFLGKPTTNENFTSEISMVGRETGLVSSRISLFHKISNTEPLPWSYRKCQSLYNLTQQKYSDTNMALEEVHLVNKSFQNVSETNEDKSQNYMVQNTNCSMQDIRLSDKDEHETIEQSHSFDESKYQSPDQNNVEKKKNCVKMAVKEFNEYNQPDYRFEKSKLNTSISKSEMDIFNKLSNKSSEEDLDKHKSYEELPKINVKNFISLYESVSKSSLESNSPQHYKKNHIRTQKQLAGSDSGTPEIIKTIKQKSLAEQLSLSTTASDSNSSSNSQKTAISRNISPESLSDSIEIEVISNQDQDCNYLSLSDIELEIVEKNQEVFLTPETSPERSFETENIEYKDRFQIAKQYFQSLEELREQKTTKKLNECEMLLYGVNESPKNNNANRQPGRVKKKLKTNSLPSSELAKGWNELKETQVADGTTKMVKISEKFNVEDLFTDVMDGRLSRQGSLRGIPHKKAVLEAFRSMENISDRKLSSYEMAVSQLNDFAKENHVRNAQTYLSEYPYLPTTDPSKYHSRMDTNATGLISFKELLETKPRRNSVPDLRLNESFTVDL